MARLARQPWRCSKAMRQGLVYLLTVLVTDVGSARRKKFLASLSFV